VFFGSGPVAAKTLEFLLDNFNVTDVVTKPQPVHGHKSTPPVEELAHKRSVQLHTPVDKAALTALFGNKSLPNKLGLVVDYGLIIPQSVINYFELGIVNSHFSKLPLWRGADPITFPILNGDEETGVSLMLIVAAMDEGPLLVQDNMPIVENETTESLEARLIELNNLLLKETLPAYVSGNIKLRQQDSKVEPTYSRKLTKDDGKIDWNKTAEELERQVRAFLTWPKSYTTLVDKEVVLTEAKVVERTGVTGQVFKHANGVAVYCGKDALLIQKLKVAGKSEMSGEAFLNGYMKNK